MESLGICEINEVRFDGILDETGREVGYRYLIEQVARWYSGGRIAVEYLIAPSETRDGVVRGTGYEPPRLLAAPTLDEAHAEIARHAVRARKNALRRARKQAK